MSSQELRNFYDSVKHARDDLDKFFLLFSQRGHKNLHLEADPRPVVITPKAFRESESESDSLEYIFRLAKRLNREVPFMCLMDEERLVIHATFRGVTGIFGDCWWTKGDLRTRSFAAARSKSLKVMLGHTHPANYGAVCSNVRRVKSHVYGEDYWLMRGWMKRKPKLISRYHIIMTPRANQIGIFELRSRGVVVYHPWKIGI